MITQARAGRDGEGPGGIDPFGFGRPGTIGASASYGPTGAAGFGPPTNRPADRHHRPGAAAPAAPWAHPADPPTRVLGRPLTAPGPPGRRSRLTLTAPPPRPPCRRSRLTLTLALLAGLLVAAGGVAVAHALAGREHAADEVLTVTLPPGWAREVAAPGTTAAGITLDSVASTGGYTCQGRRHSRATVGQAFVVRGDGVDARPEDAARDFGPMFAGSFYGPGAATTPGPSNPITVGARTGSVAEVRAAPAAGRCPARGVLTVLALPTDRRGPQGESGVLLLVLQRDTAGGPATPAPVAEQATDAVLDSVRVATRPAGPGPA